MRQATESTSSNSEHENAARLIVGAVGEPAARSLVRLLESSDQARAEAFRAIYRHGGPEALLDILTDLEADPFMRCWLVENLRIVLDASGAS